MNGHWQEFARELPWFVAGRDVRVGKLLPPGSWHASDAFGRLFPRLGRLLGTASTSRVVVDGRPFTLFSWEIADRLLAWLAPLPGAAAEGVYPGHLTLLAEFGGITERAGEFEGQWLLNTTESLTQREATHDASFIRDYAWAFDEVGGIPIDLTAFYSVSREANGNCTLCHRVTGEVLLFAPDHAFNHVTPLEGCPEYTLYRLQGAPRFEAWVEEVAGQWIDEVERGRRTRG
jgi:hypothetical protein